MENNLNRRIDVLSDSVYKPITPKGQLDMEWLNGEINKYDKKFVYPTQMGRAIAEAELRTFKKVKQHIEEQLKKIVEV